MNQLLLAPTDILFFRDGRPMSGASTGHGAAWPLPTVTNAALHAALWRSGLASEARSHQRKTGRERTSSRAERFGSLITAGPFPVCTKHAAPTWFFPRPLDAEYHAPDPAKPNDLQLRRLAQPSLPLPGAASSNPLPLAVAAIVPPSKDTPAPWWSESAWSAYLGTAPHQPIDVLPCTIRDSDFSDSEAYIGIGLDPATGTQDGERFYSAHYLRLRDDWRLGLFAATADKFADAEDRRGERDDLIPTLISQQCQILVGGQQRLCSTQLAPADGSRLPLPLGQAEGFATAPLPHLDGEQPRHLVKWVLLSPAIFPALPAAAPAHPGGWLPSWIHPESHAIQLRAPVALRDLRTESRDAYRARIAAQPFIAARLVAALVGKPIPVTGWSLGTPDAADIPQAESREAGAKPTHLAVPAGSIYYFACDTAEAATQLAAALNWHGGDATGTTIRNRRSALLGEKGFGLGVCGTWTPTPGAPTSPSV